MWKKPSRFTTSILMVSTTTLPAASSFITNSRLAIMARLIPVSSAVNRALRPVLPDSSALTVSVKIFLPAATASRSPERLVVSRAFCPVLPANSAIIANAQVPQLAVTAVLTQVKNVMSRDFRVRAVRFVTGMRVNVKTPYVLELATRGLVIMESMTLMAPVLTEESAAFPLRIAVIQVLARRLPLHQLLEIKPRCVVLKTAQMPLEFHCPVRAGELIAGFLISIQRVAL